MAKRHDQAATHIRVAVELNPNDAWTVMAAGLFEAFAGQSARALDFAQRSLALTQAPTASLWARYAFIQFFAGDDAAALTALDQAPDATPVLPAWHAAILHNLGRHDAAREQAGRFLAGVRANWFGPQPPSDAAIGRWMLHINPISRLEMWERLRTGLIGAGIPDGGQRFNDW